MSPEGEVRGSAGQQFGLLIDAQTLAMKLGEPLLESAPVGFDMAMEGCAHDSACQAYHAIWQYLRLAGLVRSVRVDGPIYVAMAERLARAGRLRRVLISATADYSMLAHLAYGARQGGADPEFHVVDRCATPLRLNEWYGAKNSLKVRTFQADALEYADHDGYDLICSHSLLTLLPIADRPRLFEQWRLCLGAEGRICFSNRVWNEHITLGHEELGRRVTAMTNLAAANLLSAGVPLPCERGRFLDLVGRYSERYGQRQDHLPPLPMTDMERWIAEAGLAIEIAVPAAEVVPEAYDRAPGPFPVERGPRMWFQLRRA